MEGNLEINKKSVLNSGVSNGVISAITWGADTVLIGIVITMVSNIDMLKAVFLAPFVSAFLHDAFSTVWLIIYLGIKNQLKNVFVCLKTKSAKYVIIGGLLGGPIGMAGYLLAIKYLGPSYTAAISSIYPAVGAIMAKILLKEKMNKTGWIGLILSILGIISLGYTKGDQVGSVLGFLFVALCIVGWGSEAVVCSIGMKDDEISSDFALLIRQGTSAIIYGALVVPLIGGIGLSLKIATEPVIILLMLTALFGTLSYLFYYSAIYKIGPSRAMGINITYFVWAIIFETIFMGAQLSLKTIIFGALVMFGSYLIAKDS